MLKVVEYEAKTKEEALQKCLNELSCSEKELLIRTEEVEGKLFKSGKCVMHAYKKRDISEFIKEYISQISIMANIPMVCDILIKEDTFNVTLVSEESAILIGKEGRTLNALQLMLKQTLKKETGCLVKVNLDVSNYKKKKMENLERQIKEIAKEILDTKIDATLDPMNSYERRFVHTLIGEYANLKTESIGEGKERYIVIKYVGE